MYTGRINHYRELERARKSKVLVYVTGDRPQMETMVSPEVIDFFAHHLDIIGDVDRISLYLYTRGGHTLAAWTITNLLRQFCNHLEVIVPSKAHSAGTLMCLGANSIVMTKQATLGPIDPSVTTPLNPQLIGAPPQARVPVSVEDVNAFIDFANGVLGDEAAKKDALLALANNVHPLVLGNAFRARSQIKMLAKKLISNQLTETDSIEQVLSFLCSESGSHDYTINRREARDELQLPIEKPDDALYALIKRIYDDVATELQLTVPYDPMIILGGNPTAPYTLSRALIESVDGGSHAFVSEGVLNSQQIQMQPGVVQTAVHDQRTFEGWRHSNA